MKALHGWIRSLSEKGRRFLFTPASPLPLAWLRIGLALTLLIQALSLSTQALELYGDDGILQGALSEYAPGGWLSLYRWLSVLTHLGLSQTQSLFGLIALYLTALLCLLVGWKTRLATIVVWFTQLLLTLGQTTSYGLDQFAHMTLFLLMWMPAGDALSLDCQARNDCGRPSWEARLSLRTVQIWLCIAYLGSGLTKAFGLQWWDGEAIWRSLMLPTYIRFDMAWLAANPWIPRLLGWGTLVIETGYAFFIWPRRTRGLWVALTVSLHLGIGVFLKLHLFALVMCVLTLSVFGISAEPQATRLHLLDWVKTARAGLRKSRVPSERKSVAAQS